MSKALFVSGAAVMCMYVGSFMRKPVQCLSCIVSSWLLLVKVSLLLSVLVSYVDSGDDG